MEVAVTDAGTGSVAPAAAPTSVLESKFGGNVAELEKAYKELEGKLGQPAEPTPAAAEIPKEGDKAGKGEGDETPKAGEGGDQFAEASYGAPVDAVLFGAGLKPQDVAAEWAANEALSEGTYEKLAQSGYDKDTVDTFIQGQVARNAASQGEADTVVTKVHERAGGTEEFGKLQTWMRQNVPQAQLESFNRVVSTGSEDAILHAVDAMMGKYRGDVGHEPVLLGGKQAGSTVQTFGSTQALVEAMKDPRYKTDPSYRAEVARRLNASKNVLATK